MVITLKRSALFANHQHAVVLNFSKKYKMWLIQSGHSFTAFLSVQTRRSECIRDIDIGRSLESVYGYSTSQVLEAGEMIPVMSGVRGRERIMHILHESMRLVLDDL